MKKIICLFSISIFLFGYCLESNAQNYTRIGLGAGMYKAYRVYESRSLPISFSNEFNKIMPGVGTGFFVSYANYMDSYGEVLPGISVGSSNSLYIFELYREITGNEISAFLGNKLSPYVSLQIGLNLGAGFSQNNIVYTENRVRIFTIKVPFGVAFYPVKNIGIFGEFFGQQSRVSGGLTFRFGKSL